MNKTKLNYYNYHFYNDNYNHFNKPWQNNLPYKIKEFQNEQKWNYKKKYFINNISSNKQNPVELIGNYEKNSMNRSNSNLIQENNDIKLKYNCDNLNKEKDDYTSLSYYKGSILCNPILPNNGQDGNEIYYNNQDVENEYNIPEMKRQNFKLNLDKNRDYDIITGQQKNLNNQSNTKKPIHRQKRSNTTSSRFNKSKNKIFPGYS